MADRYDADPSFQRDPLDEAPGAGPLGRGARRKAFALGCLIALVLLVGLIWFGVTHTETTGQGKFGF